MSQMLNEFRRIFRRSVEAFRSELNAMEPEDQVAELLMAMRRELVAARAALPEYEAELSRARSEFARERDALVQCERRGALAARIDDHETVRIAEEFAARHRTRIGVLEQKVAASEAELALRRDEADEMRRRYQEADANRFALLAQLRRSAAQEGMRAATDPGTGPSADFARMQERVERDAHYADALEQLDESEAPPSGPAPETVVEERLRELKRRMGRADPGAG
jgi:phage shock protein A